MTAVQWLESYKKAWEEQNRDLIADLFTEDGLYYETPFKVYSGKEEIKAYWDDAPGSQKDIHFEFKVLNEFDNFAFAHWQAEFSNTRGKVELDGMFYLEFGDNGLCAVLREWWHAKDGKCKA